MGDMSSLGIFDSVRIENDVAACEECGSTSRVGRGLCLNCLLHRGLGADTENTETLEEVLDAVDVRDADWRLGNYQILEEIGRGGMGVIYRARQRHSRRIVALKRVLNYHADSRETLARFRREAEAAASLDHPNILPIYEVSESEDGLPFFSMKFAAGGSLVDVARSLRSDPRRIVRLIAKVTRAVQHAHAQGILHRDLKPGNILLDGRGEPLVSDFGLAKWLDASSDLTRTLTIFGTPGYIAPEQAQGPAKNLTAAADIYSIGAVLFDLFTGRPPFLGEHALAVIKQASDKPAPKLRGLAPSTDRDLETICARCLEREPQTRYRTAGDLAEDLERWLEGRPIIARPVLPPVRVWRWSKRNPKLAGSLAACLLLGAAAIVWQTQSRNLSATVREGALAQNSVAIAPFTDLDELSTTSPPARGIMRALLAGLGEQTGLRLKSTVSRFGEDTDFWRLEDWRNIGTTLGVRKVLTGTTRKRNGDRRVVLHVIDSGSGAVVARRICEFADNDSRYQSVIRAATEEVKAALEQKDPAQAARRSANPTSEQYLRAGKEYYVRYTPSDTRTSIQYFEKAVQADPLNAEAQAFLAIAWSRHFQQQAEDFTEEKQARALAAASAAVKLNPELALGYRARAALISWNNVVESQDAALSALELDPSDSLPAGFIGLAWRMRGRPDLALQWLKRSAGRGQRPGMNSSAIADALTELEDDEAAEEAYGQQLEFWPDVPDGHVGLARLWMYHHDFARARQKCEEALTRYPDHFYPRQMLAIVKFFARDFAEAEKDYRKLVETDRSGGRNFYACVSNLSALGFLRSRAGDRQEGERLLTEALQNGRASLSKSLGNRELLYDIAAIHSAIKDREQCFETLARAIEAGWIDYRAMSMDPRFDFVREDLRFKTILTQLGTKVRELRRQKPADQFNRAVESALRIGRSALIDEPWMLNVFHFRSSSN